MPVGTIYQADSVPAYLRIDDLMGKHFSIVGTTGSGKSCAVATILRAVIDHNPNAHVMLLDPHNEYARAFAERAVVLSPDDGLRLPYWLFNFEELAEIVLGSERADLEQRKILAETVLAAKQAHFSKNGLDKVGSVDTPVPYRMSDVLTPSRPGDGRAQPAGKRRRVPDREGPHHAAAERLALRLRVRPSPQPARRHVGDPVAPVPHPGRRQADHDPRHLGGALGGAERRRLAGLPADLRFRDVERGAIPITIVCEEAHRYAPRDKELGFEPAKRALSRIAKEGRKYGVSLCVVTQRPSDLAPSLLSECNTMFALRMTNHDDQDILRDALSEASHGLMNFLPALRNGEAIAVGEGVSMPMRICFSPLPDDSRPKSSTASFTGAWSRDIDGRAAVIQTVERWRRGQRHAA